MAAALLVAVPGTYVVIASVQSLDGSDRKERVAAATEPLPGRPDTTTRNIYEVPLPVVTWHNWYFETNSWKSSSLYVRSEMTAADLEVFLAELGTSRRALVEGSIPITPEQRATFDWKFDGPWSKQQRLAGVALPAEKNGAPAHRIVVNLVEEYYATVYVVSTITY